MSKASDSETLLQGLRAAGEQTRLRILGICAHAEVTVSDLIEILGQSQPRVSRHLKLLMEAGLLERNQEGSWAYYRLAARGANAELARLLVDILPADDPQHALDLERLQQVTDAWAVKAQAYFRRHAPQWDDVRGQYVDMAEADRALLEALPAGEVKSLLDLGTGAGHVLGLLGDRIEMGVGVDRSRDMLIVARSTLFKAGLAHCQVRQADVERLPFPGESFDAVTVHLALHYFEQPRAAIAEAARVLKPGGRLIVIDLAPHERAELRLQHAHRWLGFADSDLADHFAKAGLEPLRPRRLDGGWLPARLWVGVKPANDRLAGIPQAAGAES